MKESSSTTRAMNISSWSRSSTSICSLVLLLGYLSPSHGSTSTRFVNNGYHSPSSSRRIGIAFVSSKSNHHTTSNDIKSNVNNYEKKSFQRNKNEKEKKQKRKDNPYPNNQYEEDQFSSGKIDTRTRNMILMTNSPPPSPSSSSSKKYHPPWLENTKLSNYQPSQSQQNKIDQSKAKYNLYTLRQKLHIHHLNHPTQFTIKDITSVINSIFVASQNNLLLISSTALFLSLLLDIDEDYGNYYDNDDNSNDTNDGDSNEKKEKFIFISKDTLVASSFHYCECVIAREMGLYDVIHSVMRSTTSKSTSKILDRVDLEQDLMLINAGTSTQENIDNNQEDWNNLEIMKDDEDDDNVLAIDIPSGNTRTRKHRNHDDETDFDDVDENDDDDGSTTTFKTLSSSSLVSQRQNQSHDNHQKDQDMITSASNDNDIDENINVSNKINNEQIHTLNIASFGPKATQIYQNVARLKRTEIMSHAMLPRMKSLSSSSSFSSISISKVSPSPEKAASLRGLLLSTTNGDWNALAIRLTASLYRLRGILHHQQQNYYKNVYENEEESQAYNKEIVREAREALQIYAPLAQRLGMKKLKMELENQAFRILYKRQYIIAKSLYMKSGVGENIDSGGITAVATFLESEIEKILHSDAWLVDKLDRLTISGRVKQPYSLWKKLLSIKRQRVNMKKKLRLTPATIKGLIDNTKNSTTDGFDPKVKPTIVAPTNSQQHVFESNNVPSISSVQDAIALRVIFKAKQDVGQNQESNKSLEKFLCYYIQNRLIKSWPVVDESRIKDYISQPKPNGYQSLHHTSFVYRFGQCWPFEVQVRTEDMHTKSEFGVASHWEYKLQGSGLKTTNTLPDQPKTYPSLLLDSEDNVFEKEKLLLSAVSNDNVRSPIPSLQPTAIIESYINALDTARGHLLKNNVFIFFLPSNVAAREGKVLGIPAGSTVLDAFTEICSRCQVNPASCFKNGKFDAYVNGQQASMNNELKTGDTLIIPALDGQVIKL